MRHLFTTAILVTTLGAAAPALAQSPEAQSRAETLNNEGVTAFQDGRFADAAKAFSQAADLVGDPALRKNEAIAWFKAKECQPAVAAGNKFLLQNEAPDEDRRQVETVVANCKVQFASEAAEAGEADLAEKLLLEAEAMNPDSVVRDEIAVVRLDIARQRKEVDDAGETGTGSGVDTEVAEPAPAKEIGPLPYALLGAGGGIIVGTLVYHAVALGWQGKAFDMSENGGDPEEFEGLKKRVNTARNLVPLLYLVGATTAGAGGVMLTLALTSEKDTTGTATAGRSTTMYVGIQGTF